MALEGLQVQHGCPLLPPPGRQGLQQLVHRLLLVQGLQLARLEEQILPRLRCPVQGVDR